MGELYRIQDELKGEKEVIRKKGEGLSNILSLNKSLIKKVKNLKQENTSKGKWKKDESRGDLKNKDEEIRRLQNHNKKLQNEVKRLKEENKNCENQEETRIVDEEPTKILEEGICKKIEEYLNIDQVKLELQSKIEEEHYNLINGVTLQLQKEKEDKIEEGQQKILQEVEIYLEDVHAKYDGIISKARTIKEQQRKIEDYIVSKNNVDEMHVYNEEKPSNVKPYQHPHYQEIFQGKKEDQYRHYQGRRWNNHQYSWNMASHNHYSVRCYDRPTSITNWMSFNKNTWNQRK
jgi:hypothetical protein